MKTWKTPRRPLKITVCITPQLNAIQTIPGAVFIWQTDDKQIDRRQKKKKQTAKGTSRWAEQGDLWVRRWRMWCWRLKIPLQTNFIPDRWREATTAPTFELSPQTTTTLIHSLSPSAPSLHLWHHGSFAVGLGSNQSSFVRRITITNFLVAPPTVAIISACNWSNYRLQPCSLLAEWPHPSWNGHKTMSEQFLKGYSGLN